MGLKEWWKSKPLWIKGGIAVFLTCILLIIFYPKFGFENGLSPSISRSIGIYVYDLLGYCIRCEGELCPLNPSSCNYLPYWGVYFFWTLTYTLLSILILLFFEKIRSRKKRVL